MNDTIVALATPQGNGALALIRISGSGSFKIVDDIFVGANLSKVDSHTIHYGRICDGDKVVDECLIFVYHGPNTYTGEDIVEISCHGSSYVIQQIMNLVTEKGARLALPGEYTKRAFLNGKMDLSQAEAVADLIASETAAAHNIAIQQLRGGVSNEIQKLRTELIDFGALIELELDFSEEDVEFADRSDLKNLVNKLLGLIQPLIATFRLGNAIKTGVNTVIAGRPNAGKSTLLNALLNEERAIVTAIPGTTRDSIEEVLNIRGVPFRLIDTAGIRRTQNQIERIGVERTIQQISKSTIVIYMFDVTSSTPNDLWQDVDRFLQGSKALTAKSQQIFVANKMDLNPYTQPATYYKEGLIGEHNLITASAKNKMNIDYLQQKLFDLVIADTSLTDQTIISNSRHFDALDKTQTALNQVLNGLKTGLTSDLIASDIRSALHHLGEITGEIHTDDLLDSIFTRFCIGK